MKFEVFHLVYPHSEQSVNSYNNLVYRILGYFGLGL